MSAERIDRVRLIADGHKIADMRREGYSTADILLVVGGSRARLYRALKAIKDEQLKREEHTT